MASKQIQDIKIRLGIDGLEGLDKLKSSLGNSKSPLVLLTQQFSGQEKAFLILGKKGKGLNSLSGGRLRHSRA